MDEELCLVDSGTTNSILRETKIFPNSYKETRKCFDNRWTRCNDSWHWSCPPMGTHITIEDALLYPDSKISVKTVFILKPVMTIMRNSSSLLKITDMANKLLNKFLLFRPDCTTHTLNPYHMLRTR